MTPTSRTLKVLRDDGWMAGIVERFITAGANRQFGNRTDLFGLFDLVALEPSSSPGILGIQVFTTAWREHEEKFKELEDVAITWIKSGIDDSYPRFDPNGNPVSRMGIELWGWRKLKLHRGSKAIRWTPKIKRVKLLADDTLSIEEIHYV